MGAAEEAAAALEELVEAASNPTLSDTETAAEVVGAVDELLQVEVGVLLLLLELQVELLEELEEESELPSEQKEIKRLTLSVCNGSKEC